MKITETGARLLNPFLDELSDKFYLQMLLRHVERFRGKHGEVYPDVDQKWS